MNDEIYLSIVIPAYKEEKRIHIILDAIAKYEKTKEFAVETIVVVDGSPDNTKEAALKYASKLKNLRIIGNEVNKGKGKAINEGMLAAHGQYILFADADNSTPVEQVDKLLKHCNKYDIVIGSRYCPGGKLAIPQSLIRRLGSRALNLLIQAVAIPGVKDTQCGFKLFKHDAVQRIFTRQTIFSFSFDIELLVIGRKLGYKIKETGITWYDDPHSTVSPIKDGIKMIKESLIIRKNLLTGVYKT